MVKFECRPTSSLSARASCLTVYDDMDLPFGTVRLRQRGSPGTHNGMRSVVSSLESDDVPRLRIGISQASPGEATSHVLSEFTPDQRAAVYDTMNAALAKLHNLDPLALGLGDFGRSGNYFARQLARWSDQYRASQTEALALLTNSIK